MCLRAKGDLDDSTSGNEPLWISIAKDKMQVAHENFSAAGGASASGTRTIQENWSYVDIEWLIKIKTDSEGNVHYEKWSQPRKERMVLTKPKILCVLIDWLRVDKLRVGEDERLRYVMAAATYQRLLDAVKPR